jgi:hypothetical protein
MGMMNMIAADITMHVRWATYRPCRAYRMPRGKVASSPTAISCPTNSNNHPMSTCSHRQCRAMQARLENLTPKLLQKQYKQLEQALVCLRWINFKNQVSYSA